MAEFLNYIVQGISLGSIYAMSALGVVVIYKATHIFNFAQGNIALVGAYFLFTFFVSMSLPIWLGFLLTLLFSALFGAILDKVALRPLIGQPLISSLMVTIALMIGIAGFSNMIWGTSTKSFPEPLLSVPVHIGFISTSSIQIFGMLSSLIVFALIAVFFKYTKLGLAMRATAESHDVSRSLGVGVKNIFTCTWALAGILGAISGITLASLASLTPDLGVIGLIAFPIVLLGGLESIKGTLIAGVLIGVVEILTAAYIDPLVGGEFRGVTPYILLLIVLFFKPHGLFGEEHIERI